MSTSFPSDNNLGEQAPITYIRGLYIASRTCIPAVKPLLVSRDGLHTCGPHCHWRAAHALRTQCNEWLALSVRLSASLNC